MPSREVWRGSPGSNQHMFGKFVASAIFPIPGDQQRNFPNLWRPAAQLCQSLEFRPQLYQSPGASWDLLGPPGAFPGLPGAFCGFLGLPGASWAAGLQGLGKLRCWSPVIGKVALLVSSNWESCAGHNFTKYNKIILFLSLVPSPDLLLIGKVVRLP